MKTLSKNLYNEINRYMDTDARPLERALFNYYFNNSSEDNILDELKKFQNSDGGFGQGIEPDFKLIQSSPMATSIGLRHLSKIDGSDRAKGMIGMAIKYLELTFDRDRNGWYSVPSDVNNHPHAPWWEFKSDINMTVIDYSWGNPSAELTGYIYKYKEYLDILDAYSLIDYATNNFNKRTEFSSEHEIYCYIRMYNLLDEEIANRIVDNIELAVSQLVNLNQDEWTNYVPTPLKFIEMNSNNNFGIENRFINQNLDYLIDKLEDNGKILPPWQWDDYLKEWEVSKIEWIGILTLEALLTLLKFKRI